MVPSRPSNFLAVPLEYCLVDAEMQAKLGVFVLARTVVLGDRTMQREEHWLAFARWFLG